MKKLLALLLAALMLCYAIPTVFAETDATLTSRDDFLWGACTYVYASKTDVEYEMALAAQLGVKLVRMDYVTQNVAKLDDAVRLANAYGIKVMLVYKSLGAVNDESYNAEAYTAAAKAFAERYNGLDGKPKVDYIQIGNEIDNDKGFLLSGSGNNKSDFDVDYAEAMATRINAVSAGIRAAETDAQIVINFSWKHWGMLMQFADYNVDYDIIGWAWYGDMQNNSTGLTRVYTNLRSALGNDKPVMVVESNIRPNAATDESSAASWDVLVDIMEEAYATEGIIGMCIYELTDKSYDETGGYTSEGHYGLVNCTADGIIGEKKAGYTRIQSIMGGNPELEVITLESVTPAFDAPPESVKKGNTKTASFEDEDFIGTWGDQFNYAADRILKQDFEPVDLSGANYIEFDIYIEDVETLKAAMATAGVTNIGFSLSSGSNRYLNRVMAMFTDQLTKDGWNHIALKKTSFTTRDGTPDWSAMKNWMISFEPVKQASNPESVQYVKVANVLGSKFEAEDNTNIYSVVYDVKSEPFTPANAGTAVYIKADKSEVALSEADYVEFDMYLDEGTQMTVWLCLDTTYRGRANVGWVNQKLGPVDGKEGWYHFCIPASFEGKGNTGLEGFTPSGAKPTSFKYIQILLNGSANHVNMVDNIALTKDTTPAPYDPSTDLNVEIETKDNHEIVHTLLEGGVLPGSTAWVEGSTVFSLPDNETVPMSEVDYVEFDVYLDENTNMKCFLGSSATPVVNGRANISYTSFAKDGEGWYHICIPANYNGPAGNLGTTGFTKANGDTESATVFKYVMFELNQNKDGTNHVNYVRNVVFTEDPAEKGDVNGDGEIDVLDLVRLKKLVAGDEVDYEAEASNVDGIGVIDALDLAALRRLILGV